MAYVIFNDIQYKAKKGKLVLKNKGISSISDIKGLEHFQALKELDLSDNYISEISDLNHLENIYSLNLSNNNITEIKGLDNLKFLRFLNLSHNSIQEIKGLESLTNLMTLQLNGNKIDEIKGLDNLTYLNALYLADNNITEVKGIDSLHNLKRFDIGHTSKLPKEQVKQLKELNKKGLHTKDQNYFSKRFAKRLLWYTIGIFIASLLITWPICGINGLDLMAFLGIFTAIFALLFICAPILYVIGRAYAGV